ncbi:polysaccharide pyruvyl transferase family protein [Aneurinibacillus sp. UBA3580]|jgi:MoaA/NifB/PqqE/SkfB family radical SAM enzyme/polysaccharide pyruvyl transferase WcaK-like protein|uniref:polysaccharide pyruvyl transferase family protein n=1 Tax=Aneurinibacillus sp. UBA3580 TaxID=1946041 RepID=UPI00257CA4C7|nr:polysaccharide pyruvyl transferase family protein [Aneurinibacillus sp. UBA3580]
MLQWLEGKKIVMFGSGGTAKLVSQSLPYTISYYIDNNPKKWNTTFMNNLVLSPDTLKQEDKNNLTILVASMYYDEISQQLSEMGFIEEEHFFNGMLLGNAIANLNRNKGKIVYPKVVNYPITNKCNYRCIMCNVWKPEYAAHKDLTPSEIYNVFSQPLFKELAHVGISGGEPFVRKDILEIIKSICDAVPSLKSISIITNASLEHTFEKVKQIKEELDARKIHFTLQISIDGVDEVHDKNRGVPKAFERTIKNFYKLNAIGLVSEISTTITKNNYNKLWDIYRFAKDNNVYIRFRLASSIDRLYNSDLTHNFSFNDREKLTIIKFLENIIFYYEKDVQKRFFYRSLIGQLKGQKRKAGCDWQTSQGVSLDPYGNLYFCFPKSKLIKNINSDSSEYDIQLLEENIDKLDDALHHCSSCTHDYTAELTLDALYDNMREHVEFNENFKHNTEILNTSIEYALSKEIKKVKKVSIVGWYGTETLGDKAILGGIIDNLVKDGIKLDDITVVSLHPTYTRLTLHEMGISVIKTASTLEVKVDDSFISSQDLFIFGGGPLCDVEPLVDMLEIFLNAKKHEKLTMIYACGIGPLKEKRYIKALNKLIDCSDKIALRDEQSLNKYKSVIPQLYNRGDIKTFIDPATKYIINNIDKSGERIIKEEYALFSFRDWPYMYADGLNEEEYELKKKQYELKMIELIKETLDLGLKVVLMPMHNYYMGDDDREFYFNILYTFDNTENIQLITHDYTPLEAINYFKYAKFAVCLRFHSVVFALSCNTPCIAIDYHYGKGKITGFVSTLKLDNLLYDMDAFIKSDANEIISCVLNQKVDWQHVNQLILDQNKKLAEYMCVRG